MLGTIRKYISKTTFVSQKIFNPVLTLEKPVNVGFSILDLSKLLMYEFHYGYVKRKNNVKLLYTDSLVYETETKDVYEDFYQDKSLFDLSNYPQDLKFSGYANKKVIGKMKDEFGGRKISEFVGWKMYSLVDLDGEENKKAKAVIKNVVKGIRHKKFVDVLFGGKRMRRN